MKRFKYGITYHNNMVNHKFSLREKILKFLIEKKEKHTILEISKALNTDYKNVFQSVGSMPDLIYREKKGSLNLIEIKTSPNNDIYSVEEKRTAEFLDKNKGLKLVLDDVKSLNYPFLIVLVFGSIAGGTGSKTSDIDLCVISDNERRSKELISKLNLLPLKLEIHDFTINEFESMLDKKEGNVAKEIIKNNIILYGIGNYYNLVSKWMKKE